MFFSLALILILGLALGGVFEKIKLPSLIGMLLTGILLGPFVLNLIDDSLLLISEDLRKIALVIILIKAGLSLDFKDLKAIGRPALFMSFIPASCEIIAMTLLAPKILGVTAIEGAVIGAVLGAVSPAVVVPKMVNLIENNYGNKKRIPQLILAGSSLDDIFVIVMFTSFISIAQGEKATVLNFVQIPVSIITGVIVGLAIGFVLVELFKRSHFRDSVKVVIILGISFLLVALETFVKDYVGFSSLLAVICLSMTVKWKRSVVAVRLSKKFSKLWVGAELFLFVLVGAAVDITYVSKAGAKTLLLIVISLTFRMVGVLACLIKTNLNAKEKFFCVISYLPKATVQAAIGSIPLALNLPCGKIVLTMAVLAILITAPLGAIGIDLSYNKLLKQGE